jgi:hypothetical protein
VAMTFISCKYKPIVVKLIILHRGANYFNFFRYSPHGKVFQTKSCRAQRDLGLYFMLNFNVS